MSRFAVVTRVPDAGQGERGNLACAIPLYVEDPKTQAVRQLGTGPAAREEAMMLIQMRSPVFSLGEIVVLSEDGREIGGAGRKPDKWDIDVETFGLINHAIARSLEVS